MSSSPNNLSTPSEDSISPTIGEIIPFPSATMTDPAQIIEDPALDPKLLRSTLLFPFRLTDCTVSAFLGPFSSLKKIEASKASFPASEDDFILASKPEIIPTSFIANINHVFRSSPTADEDLKGLYLRWLDRVEASKGELWKKNGIFSLIQLSRATLLYNHSMLISSFLFWSRNTNSFHFPYGMMSPTLLDVSIITGLKPTGYILTGATQPSCMVDVNFAQLPFSHFIRNNQGEEHTEVSDAEHVAFLLLWLCMCVFCTKSLQIVKRMWPLAVLLHEDSSDDPPCLAKLLLADLYQSLNEAVDKFKKGSLDNSGGPFWLLQLWLNSIMQPFLISPSPDQVFNSEGSRLAAIQQPSGRSVAEDVEIYTHLLGQIDNTSVGSYSLFLLTKCQIPPPWLRLNIHVPGEEENKK